MRRIKDLADHIAEELDGAKEYAETYLDYKVKGNGNRASQYKSMAQDELNHANIIHDVAVSEIAELSKVYTPPSGMEEAWTKSHKEYVEKAAWIKQMLTM